MVGSYYTTEPGMTDPIDRKPLNRLREEQDRDYSLVEWSRHHALRAAETLQRFAATRTDFRQPVDAVERDLEASVADVNRVLSAFQR
jgi:hypothetical protein